MKNCIDEEIMQAWFDGELPADEAAKVAAHLRVCVECAESARTVEAENQILSEGLAAEFAAPVPTERLREHLDAAVAGLNKSSAPASRESPWLTVTEFFGSLRLLAYASAAAIIVLAAFLAFVYLKKDKAAPPRLVQDNPRQVSPTIPKDSPGSEPAPNRAPQKSPEFAAVNPPQPARRPKAPAPDATSFSWQEHQYQYAIARLKEAIKTQPPMRPALQVDYEFNIAVIDNAIATTRDAARKNPKDPLTNQFVLAAYQSKIDFMNQIADARVLEK